MHPMGVAIAAEILCGTMGSEVWTIAEGDVRFVRKFGEWIARVILPKNCASIT